MKKTIFSSLLSALALSGAAQVPADSVPADTVPADTAFVFTEIINIPVTSVKDQNKSGTCWCFAGTSFFEDEILKAGGDSLDLSEMFTVRYCYLDKADKFIRLSGMTNFSPGGSSLDVPYVWQRYGAVPEQVYTGLQYGEDKHVHGELNAAIKAYLEAVVSNPNRRLSTAWRRGLEAILDAYLGPVPESFEYNGRTYTPQTFAASLPINVDNYVPVTSFTHHPFYTQFPVEVPDNWLWGDFYNVPLDEMKEIVDASLQAGHTVVWAADVSEGGFKWTDGVALMPVPVNEGDLEGSELARWVHLSDRERNDKRYDFHAPVQEMEITQENRQEMFDRQETTDDHAMEIVGTATDQKGNRYYKVRNSWDTNQKYDGFFYVSEPYFLAKTVNVLVHKDVIPSNIKRKMGINR